MVAKFGIGTEKQNQKLLQLQKPALITITKC